MKSIIILLLTLAPLSLWAQDTLPDSIQQQTPNARSEEEASESIQKLVDSVAMNFIQQKRQEQVKSIAGLRFGTLKEDAQVFLINKFGTYERPSNNRELAFKNIRYAGVDFSFVMFLFQSDGINSFFNQCVFAISTKTLEEALKEQENLKNTLSQKYELFETKGEYGPMYLGGVNPLWDGKVETYFNSTSLISAFIVDIIKYPESDYSGNQYAVRLNYGPYPYVHEEF